MGFGEGDPRRGGWRCPSLRDQILYYPLSVMRDHLGESFGLVLVLFALTSLAAAAPRRWRVGDPVPLLAEMLFLAGAIAGPIVNCDDGRGQVAGRRWHRGGANRAGPGAPAALARRAVPRGRRSPVAARHDGGRGAVLRGRPCGLARRQCNQPAARGPRGLLCLGTAGYRHSAGCAGARGYDAEDVLQHAELAFLHAGLHGLRL